MEFPLKDIRKVEKFHRFFRMSQEIRENLAIPGENGSLLTFRLCGSNIN